jgi:acyl carrier protein
MSEQESRLIRCFASVFPGLTPEEIRTARTESLEAWDSLAAVTLAAVVEQEFRVQIDLLKLPELNSFEAFLTHLRRLSLAEEQTGSL